MLAGDTHQSKKIKWWQNNGNLKTGIKDFINRDSLIKNVHKRRPPYFPKSIKKKKERKKKRQFIIPARIAETTKREVMLRYVTPIISIEHVTFNIKWRYESLFLYSSFEIICFLSQSDRDEQ